MVGTDHPGDTLLQPSLMTWRLVIHVLAASIWIGGQFLLAAAVGPLRRVSDDAVRAAARTFSRLAWPAFAVLIATGIWNLLAMDLTRLSTAHQVTVFVKILVALTSGVGAAIHQFGTSKPALAVGGTLGSLGAIAALFLGVLIRTGVG